jgi:HD superfamily phosphodiesterase
MEENIQHIISKRKEFIMEDHSIHGFDHWKKLKKNAIMLANQPGVDLTVVRLFAHIHDCKDKMIILILNTDKDRHSCIRIETN